MLKFRTAYFGGMSAMRSSRRRFVFAYLVLVASGLIFQVRPASAVAPLAAPLIQRAVQHLFWFAVDYGLGKAVDNYLLEWIKTQLADWLPILKNAVPGAVGEELTRLTSQIKEVERLYAIYSGVADQSYSKSEAQGLERELKQLATKYGGLEARTDRVEAELSQQSRRLDRVEERLGRIEEGLQKDCRDMKGAGVSSVGRYLVRFGDEEAVLRSSDELEGLKTRVTIYLNACTDDLTTRGILVFLQTTTDDLSQKVEAVLTFKDLQQRRMSAPDFNHIDQQRVPLFRPGPGIEGRISEIFLPHNSLPTSSGYPRLSLALVLVHGGQPLFATEKGLSCHAGQPLYCSWI